MAKFQEYLDKKGELQQKPIISDDGDTAPPPDKYPPAAALKGKNWKVTTPYDKPAPYANPGTDPGLLTSDGKARKATSEPDSLGNKGDKRLVYEPKGKSKEITTWPKKTESFLSKTKNLSLGELAEYMSAPIDAELPKVTAHKAGSFHPDPLQAIRYVAALASTSDRVMESLVFALKSFGGLDKLLRESVNHSDTYNELAFLLADPNTGERVARRLVKALSEITMQEITDMPADKDPSVVSQRKRKIPRENEPEEPQNAKTPATMNGQNMGPAAMQGIQQSQGGGPTALQPEHNLVKALEARRMLSR